ncbi:hypothetical protein [Arthrobacter sp. Soil762]|uniref:hypothetical protein n=1 Tax=Arthrobacter sp. Soil762 TaxID=1736401 RepID=UPI0006F1FC36|nr:hypothetical protein [Arthrobacter sp. Soil762]KRE72672.1 hypothetical protein ASG77_08375 [Arthrobacter sp. Soil762]
MSLATEAPHTLEEVAVRFSPDGTPMAVRHDGHIWTVDPDVHATHWFTRESWWDTQHRAPIGIGDVVSVEHWQLQTKLASNPELLTFTLRRDPLATQWLLESIS